MQKQKNNHQTTVSILCLAYNQQGFIEKCLDSLLMQKTDFKFEILIHDDASTDSTAKIIKQYEIKYPKIIKPIYQTENQYSKGVKITATYQLPRAKGEYIALCEGDDYWTDPFKLQKQVDFLNKHKDYAICFHPVKVIYEDGSQGDSVYPEEHKNFTLENLLKRNYIQTNSVLYRKQKYDSINPNAIPGDWYLHLYHAQFGKIGFIDEVMAVYRRHEKGIWWDAASGNIENIWMNHGIGHLELFKQLTLMYGRDEKYLEIIHSNSMKMLFNIFSVCKNDSTMIVDIIEKYPELIPKYVAYISEEYMNLKSRHENTEDDLERLTNERNTLLSELENANKNIEILEEESDGIKKSISWRITKPLRSINKYMKFKKT